MLHKAALLFALWAGAGCASSPAESVSDTTCVGPRRVTSFQQLAEIASCVEFSGDLTIHVPFGDAPEIEIEHVAGTLTITGSPNLIDVSWLDLQRIDGAL